MATTISPNPAYLYGMQATARKLADHASEGKPIKLFKGEHFDSLCLTRGPVPFPRPGGQIRCSFLFNGSPESQSLFMRDHTMRSSRERPFFCPDRDLPLHGAAQHRHGGVHKKAGGPFRSGRPRPVRRRNDGRAPFVFTAQLPACLGSIHSTSKRILQWLCDLCHTQKPDEDGSVVIRVT